jgi:hypothetical protein
MKNLYRMVSIGLVLLMCCASLGVHSSDEKLVEPKIDLVFVIDTTGSMSDEIREVKMHIKNVIETILAGTPKPDISIGFVIYRDYPDQEQEYVYKVFLMTTDIEAVMAYLKEIDANGGGDEEETVTIGLDVAINEMNWRVVDANGTEGAIIGYDSNQNPIYASTSPVKRMMFLIGDAPPRTREYLDSSETVRRLPDYKENIEDAKANSITIYTISGSDMNDEGIRIWQEIANETGGEYEKLTYERKNIEEYVEEEKLDEHWVDTVKNESDYDASDGTILTNSLGKFMEYAVVSEAMSLGVRYSDETSGSENQQDVLYITYIGYLLDSDNDTVFDIFHNNETGKNTTVNFKNDDYLIDVEGDGTWDYAYNKAEGLVIYQKNTAGFELFGISMILIIGVIAGVIVFLKRKK